MAVHCFQCDALQRDADGNNHWEYQERGNKQTGGQN